MEERGRHSIWSARRVTWRRGQRDQGGLIGERRKGRPMWVTITTQWSNERHNHPRTRTQTASAHEPHIRCARWMCRKGIFGISSILSFAVLFFYVIDFERAITTRAESTSGYIYTEIWWLLSSPSCEWSPPVCISQERAAGTMGRTWFNFVLFVSEQESGTRTTRW